MPDLVDQAVAALRAMPASERESLAQAILARADHDEDALEIEPEHLRDVVQGLAEVERGDFATEDEVKAAFRSFRR